MWDQCRTAVFLFAHPDDDTFIAGTMRTLLAAGVEVHGVWLTSGDYMGRADVREAELARATSVLGLQGGHIHLLRFPDLGLVRELADADKAVMELVANLQPTVLFTPAFEGGHPDHDAVNFLAYRAAERLEVAPRVFEFPLYNGTGPIRHWRWRINAFPSEGPLPLFTKLDDAAIRCKHEMMRIYASQWMFMIPARLATSPKRMAAEGEPYRPCPPDRDHTRPPHSGMLNYERWFNRFMRLSFADYLAAVLDVRKKPANH